MFKRKTVILLGIGMITILLASCGGKDICDCKTMLFDHWEEMVAHRNGENTSFMDEEEIDKRSVEKKECEPILNAYDKEMEGKSKEEITKAEEELLERCGLLDRLD